MDSIFVKDVLVKDYDPVSMLTLKETYVPKPKFPAFDFHAHIGPFNENVLFPGQSLAEIVQGLKDVGICGIVNLKLCWGSDFVKFVKMTESYADFIYTFGSVDIDRMDDVDFASHVDATFKQYKSMGIKGLKFWKNIGLYSKDKSGRFFPVDDDRLRPIWEAAAKYELITLFHVADPKAFFTPADEKNEHYKELCQFPEWIFYGPDFFTFEQMMEQQENMIATNPDTTFVIPHMGSYGENLDWVGAQLDKYPNMHIDIAARINVLGRQPYSAREFLIKYRDRIMFGTDFNCCNPTDFYPGHYRFLETFDECIEPYEKVWGKVFWNIYGVGLPDDVLEKLYFKNAYKLLRIK